MELAYTFRARDLQGQATNGVVYAAGADLAFARLRRYGLRPLHLRLHWLASLRNQVHPDVDARELARFYRAVGRRITNGRALDDGLVAAMRFLQDHKLRQAALLMRQALLDGRREHEAMALAGFARRDAMVIRAAEKSGRTGEMFLSLAAQAERARRLHRSVVEVFRAPAATMGGMYLFFYVVIHWITPRTQGFLANLGARIPEINRCFFAAAAFFNAHLVLATAAYFSLPVLLLVALRRGALSRLLDCTGPLRDMSVKADQASLWTGYALLYDAAIPPAEAARTVRESAQREDSRQAFARLERLLHAGLYLEDAVERARFPSYVADGVRAAAAGGSLVSGLRDMTADLEEDVESLAQQVREALTATSLLLLAGALVLFFLLTYYPMASVALRNV